MIAPRAGLQCFHEGAPVQLLYLIDQDANSQTWRVRPIFVAGPDRNQRIRRHDRLTPIHGRCHDTRAEINPPDKGYTFPGRQYNSSSEPATAVIPGAARTRRSSPGFVLIPVSLVPLSEALNICDPSSADPETELIQIRKDRLVRDLLDSLDPGERALAKDRFAEGRTYASIAEREGVSRKTIHCRMRKILRKLRAALEERGITRMDEIL